MATTRSKQPSPEPLGVLRGHNAAVNSARFASCSQLLSGAADGSVALWDLRTRRQRASHGAAHSRAGVLHVGRLPSGGAVTQGRDGFVRVWDVETLADGCAPLAEFYCGSFSFTKVATLRWGEEDGGGEKTSQLIVAPNSDSNGVLVYDCRVKSAAPAMAIMLPDPEKTKGMCMALSLFDASPASISSTGAIGDASGSANTYIAIGWEGGQLSLVDLRFTDKVATERSIANATHPVLSFDVNRDGSAFIVGSAGEELFRTTFNTSTLDLSAPHAFFTCNRGGFSSIRIRSDQRIFATAGWDHRVRIFHTRKLQPLAILKYHTETVFDLDFSPDSALLASASKDRKLALWSVYPPSKDAARENLRMY